MNLTKWLCAASMSALMAAAPFSAMAAGQAVTGLTGHRTPAATDLIPIQTAAGTQLLSSKASDLQDFVLTSVKAYGAAGDGVTDDTTALQNAINSGLPLYCPPGVYKISASLLVESPVNDGQTIRGSGSWGQPDAFNSATGAANCIIKPTSAVSKAIIIDGTPFTGGGYSTSWVQGFGLENLVFDMTNMSDVSTSAAIEQIQAWDGRYTRVRVINDGANKRAWLLIAGAFTSSITDSGGKIIDMEGASAAFGVTTVNVTNFDGNELICNWCANIRVIGGAFQGSTGTKFSIANSSLVDIATDIEGGGTAYVFGTNANDIVLHSELQGFSGTYMSGSPGNGSVNFDQQTNFNTYPFNLTFGGVQFNNQGAASGFSRWLSGASGSDYYLGQGRTGLESVWAIAASTNDFASGTAAGDSVIGSWLTGEALWIVGSQVPAAKATSAGFFTYGLGDLNQNNIHAVNAYASGLLQVTGTGELTSPYTVLKPTTDGDILILDNAAGTGFMVCHSNVTVGSSYCSVGNGADWRGFSDNYSTQTYDLDSANGSATFAATITAGGFAGPHNGTVGATTPAAVSATTLNVTTGLNIGASGGHLLCSAAAPTISSGFGTSPSIVSNNGSCSFQVNVGTGGTATSGVIALPTANTEWVCEVTDITTESATVFMTKKTAGTSASVTVGNFNTSAAAAAWAASDKLDFQCQAN